MKKIAIYHKTTKIVLHIVENAEILSDRINGSNKTLLGFSDWTNHGYVTIPDTYKLEDHISGTQTIEVPDPEDSTKTITETINTYDSGAYLEGIEIPDAIYVVDEYVATDVTNLELSLLVDTKVRAIYSLDNENELNRKMNAITHGLLDGASVEGQKAVSDFSAYNTFVEQCIADAKVELGV